MYSILGLDKYSIDDYHIIFLINHSGSFLLQQALGSLKLALNSSVDDISLSWDLPPGLSACILSPEQTAICRGQRLIIYAQLTGTMPVSTFYCLFLSRVRHCISRFINSEDCFGRQQHMFTCQALSLPSSPSYHVYIILYYLILSVTLHWSRETSLVLATFLVVCPFCHSCPSLVCSKKRAQEKCASSTPSRVGVLKTG